MTMTSNDPVNYLEIYLNSLPTLKDLILDVISPYDIYCELTGRELQVGGGKLIKSPLREDSKPTFGLFVHPKQDVLMFKDFAYETGDVFKFIRLFALYNDDTTVRSYYDIAGYLDYKLDSNILSNDGTANYTASKNPRFNRNLDITEVREIKFKSKPYSQFALNYWAQYYIPREVLKYFNVRSIDKLLTEDGKILRRFGANELAFAYVIYNKVKLYQPLETGNFKWRNTCPAWYIQGWKQRRGKKKLIITKSMKDIMVFFVLLGKDYDIIAPHTEGYNFPQKYVDHINENYDEVYVIYDFDRAGVNGANKLRKLYKWKPRFIDTKRIMVNNKLKVIDKDISDYIANHGPKKARKLCKKILA